ncbi:MAG: hypothetical protein ACI9RO_002203 [Alteromonas macleodii]|jgi:hypothetical protein
MISPNGTINLFISAFSRSKVPTVDIFLGL